MKEQEYQEFKTLLENLKTQFLESILQLESEMRQLTAQSGVDDNIQASVKQTDALDHTAVLKQQRDELADVNDALAKFDNGSYGICEETGEEIPLERLRVEPQARCIVEAG